MELFTVADLSHVWVEADFYEYEARLGRASARRRGSRLAYDPDAALAEAQVAYIYPELNPATRTLRVRFELANPGLRLEARHVRRRRAASTSARRGVVVPDSAILDTGERGRSSSSRPRPGRFEPREVDVALRAARAGRRSLPGLAAGEQVAVKANFLLDSESRLRAAIAGLGARAGAGPHATGATRARR